MISSALQLGAIPGPRRSVTFRVWAPRVDRVDLVFTGPRAHKVSLTAEPGGTFAGVVEDVEPHTDYFYRLEDRVDRPDPASRWQAQGVHGPSRVVMESHTWQDGVWRGLALRDAVIYELHVGTFTPEGTLDAAIEQLIPLRDLGVTAIELMPVAQFPGERNWGYDGVYPFAVQDSYGGPAALKRFVDAAHQAGLAVVLDVVYNHLGPEGNYLAEFGPYFTDRYRTPWGMALNFDGPDSDPVRRFFIENALYWQTEFHLDALRLDAVHAIRDFSAVTFLEELRLVTARQAEIEHRPFHLIAESDLNMARHILPRTLGGYGLDAQWSDDFHHALHVILTGETDGYYVDFSDGVSRLAKVWREGYAYTGEYSPHRRHRHGSSPKFNGVKQFVVCSQNHDQVGNRMQGDRLTARLSFDQLRCAAAATLLSPFIPLLFMGEEYGEKAPFQYFVSHSNPDLVEAVRNGRREEFAAFAWQGEVPDPQAEETFAQCRLNRRLLREPAHAQLHAFYRECLRLRRALPPLAGVEKETQEVQSWDQERVLLSQVGSREAAVLVVLHFGTTQRDFRLPAPPGHWRLALNSADPAWGGNGVQHPDHWESLSGLSLTLDPWSALVLTQESREEV